MAPRVTYRLHVDRPSEHLLQVTLEAGDLTGESIDVVLPSWVPGSYVLRPTSRGIVEMHAFVAGEGRPLPVELVDRGRWRVRTEGAPSVEVRYTVYGHGVTVHGVDITPEHWLLGGGFCFLYVDGRREEPCEVVLGLPAGWKAYTELSEVSTHPPRFRAATYDQLVDSPIDCGTPVVFPVTAAGVPHRIVLCGEGGNFEPHRLPNDIARIAETTIRLFGESPVERYTFLFHLSDRHGGGLEHAASTVCAFPTETFRPDRSYELFLRIACHEYFHLYNVKRIRPAVLGPFDYTREAYTKLLWWMEGTTDYYGLLLLRRAGLVTPARYLEIVAEELVDLRKRPGRAVESLEAASQRAWVDFYQQYENSPNQSISYYLKGHLVSLALDLEIRRRSEGRSSLDTALLHLWTAYGRPNRGLGEGELLGALSTSTGVDLTEFFAHHISGTRELDLEGYLDAAGLEAKPKERPTEPDPEGEAGYLGAELKNVDNRPVLHVVYTGGPANLAGFSVGDELVSWNGARVAFDGFPARLKSLGPGGAVEVGFFRRGRWRTLPLTLGTAPPEKIVIGPKPAATDPERALYRAWLGAAWEPPKAK